MIADIQTRTDVGLRRETNEDFVEALKDEGLIVVCDGMGGHEKGEVASQLAAQTITQAFRAMSENEIQEICANVREDLPGKARRLVAAVRLANTKVYEKSKNSPEMTRMGTTVVALCQDNDAFITAHVGDSRAYRYSNDNLVQITQDHTFSYGNPELDTHVNTRVSHYITRAIGFARSEKIDVAIGKAAPGDRFLLCSDGLSGYVSDEEVVEVLRKYASNKKAVEILINMANEKGGPDNITAAIATIKSTSANIPEERLDVSTVDEENTQVIEFEKDVLAKFRGRGAVHAGAVVDAVHRDANNVMVGLGILLLLTLMFIFTWLIP